MINRPYRKFAGRCYQLAYLSLLINPEWQLVHGSTRGANGSTVGHAWLEFDGMVYDPVLDVEMTARDFAEQYAASTTAIYSVQEATRATIKFGHYGPWA